MRMPIDQRLGGHIKRVEQELMAAKSAAVKESGLTVPQYAALLVLWENPGISAAGLARGCQVTPQTMTTILQNLESQGLIERTQHPWHRNVMEIRLTEAGEAAFNKADAKAVPLERRLAAAFSPEEYQTLVTLLARCSEVLTNP
jgi:DNA-binding MarR family transcriptional regulator